MGNKHQHGGKSSESLLDKEFILKTLAVAVGQTVLDAGCGNGYMAKEFARCVGPGGKVYAIDEYQPSIAQLQKEIDAESIETRVGDVTQNTGITASSVDLIYLSAVLHGFSASQREGFLREINRILKPGGILAIVEINKKDTPFGPPMDIRFSPEELIQIVNWKPLNCVKIGDYFYMQTFEKA